MIVSTLLLLGLAAAVGTSLFGAVMIAQRSENRPPNRDSAPFDLETHRAVMSMWYEMQLHLDELERSGVDVAAIRHTLETAVETILASGNRSEPTEPTAEDTLVKA